MTDQSDSTRRLTTPALTRVEGEGAMHVVIRDDELVDVELNIYEPPRFFEGFLRGRGYEEPVDITARICGICPIAYQMSACAALEAAQGIVVDGPLRDLRRLLYCGEWIESHVLHVFFLHAPDFLGYPGAIEMAADHREIVERALEMKKIGNEVLDVIGGRAIHPINIRVGGFYKVPARSELRALRENLLRGRELAAEAVPFVASLDFPDQVMDYEMVSLDSGDEYPVLGSRITSDRGLDIGVDEFPAHIEEYHVERSTALHARIMARGDYLVGPLSRYSLHADLLRPVARDAAVAAGLGATCRNPFQSIIVRAVETLHAFDLAIALIDDFVEPDRPFVEHEVVAGEGHGASEAPRGLLYHRYRVDGDGRIAEATIVPPTSQNQPTIEDDLRHFVERNLHLDDEELRRRAEVTIRNHDPCISCSTHFLELTIDRA